MISENWKIWWKTERTNILITTGAGALPILVEWLFNWISSSGSSKGDLIHALSIGELSNCIIQSLFIAITLFVLVRNREHTYNDLSGSANYIKLYLERNCGIKRYTDSTIDQSFYVVECTIMQFYYGWILVWILWLVYYLGDGVFVLAGASSDARIFKQVFDFLNSTAIFAIYLILSSVTVNIRRRAKNHSGILRGALIWVFIFTLWLAGVCLESRNPSDLDRNVVHIETCVPSESIVKTAADSVKEVHGCAPEVTVASNCSTNGFLSDSLAEPPKTAVGFTFPSVDMMVDLLLSIFSTISFLLVLGKLNSNYMQIPGPMLYGLYFYAIVQAYVPFCDNIEGHSLAISQLLSGAMPYITLAGKVILMLTLMWIANQRRLIFFVIKKSISIDESPIMLSELNKGAVTF